MSKVTAIRQRHPTGIIKRIEEARDLVFQAQSIAEVASAAAVSEHLLDEESMSTTLKVVAKMLDNVAAIIDPCYFDHLKTGTDGETA